MCSDRVDLGQEDRGGVFPPVGNTPLFLAKDDVPIILAKGDDEYDDYEDFHNDQKLYDNKPDSTFRSKKYDTKVGDAPRVRDDSFGKYRGFVLRKQKEEQERIEQENAFKFEKVHIPKRYGPRDGVTDFAQSDNLGLFSVLFILLFSILIFIKIRRLFK